MNSPSAVAHGPAAPTWATLVATFFGTGRLKPGPGTWGSLATVLLWALASSRIPVANQTWATMTAAAAVTLIGIPAATRVARASGLKDPQFVVIDEVAGQLVTLIAAPLLGKPCSRAYTLPCLRYLEAVSDSAIRASARGHGYSGG